MRWPTIWLREVFCIGVQCWPRAAIRKKATPRALLAADRRPRGLRPAQPAEAGSELGRRSLGCGGAGRWPLRPGGTRTRRGSHPSARRRNGWLTPTRKRVLLLRILRTTQFSGDRRTRSADARSTRALVALPSRGSELALTPATCGGTQTMNDEQGRLQESLERATAWGGDMPADLDAESAGLREGWLALGKLAGRRRSSVRCCRRKSGRIAAARNHAACWRIIVAVQCWPRRC